MVTRIFPNRILDAGDCVGFKKNSAADATAAEMIDEIKSFN
jgi:hypothetical protein